VSTDPVATQRALVVELNLMSASSEARIEIAPFQAAFEDEVVELIVGIQRGEFGIDITAEQQPDLRRIPSYYQRGDGNFWVALSGGRVVGTTALLDIGSRQCALRKMFVHAEHRGAREGTARLLLETLLSWSRERRTRDIFLGTTPKFLAAHRFYEKNGFSEIAKSALPPTFPIMEVDTRFYHLALAP
jgi:N-acetylglutamate synthase-like GNAT family acetyltransferase